MHKITLKNQSQLRFACRTVTFCVRCYNPCNKILSEKQICADLIKIMQKIGQKEYLYDVEQNVICKLINQTLMLREKWENTEKTPEIAFLKA